MGAGAFLTGKIPPQALVNLVFRYTGRVSRRVLIGPAIGEDAAVIAMGEKVLVAATDPITGATRDIGWLSVHVNANDVACAGARPLWYLCTILLPPGAGRALLKGIMHQVHEAALRIGATVIGGHSEVTPGLRRPIVIGAMLGEASRGDFVSSGGAEVGDDIIMTKGAGLEGTAILAREFGGSLRRKVSPSTLARARGFIYEISVVKDCMTLIKGARVHAMHDPTEGGVLMGLWELAEASGVGFTVYEEAISVYPETSAICRALRLNPLRLMSSGTLLAAVDPRSSEKGIKALRRRGVLASRIGSVEPRRHGRKMALKDGGVSEVKAVPRDELYRILPA